MSKKTVTNGQRLNDITLRRRPVSSEQIRFFLIDYVCLSKRFDLFD